MNADDRVEFRLARLVLLLSVVAETDPDGVDAERLGIYDFLAAHPLLVARDDPDRAALRLAGFDDRGLGYASLAHRFVTAQLRLPGDLGVLIGRGLVEVSAQSRIRFRLTPDGHATTARLTAMYAQAYVLAARIVLRRLRRRSSRGLRADLRGWLNLRVGPEWGAANDR